MSVPKKWRDGDRCEVKFIGRLRLDPWCPPTMALVQTDDDRVWLVPRDALDLVPLPEVKP